MNAIEYLRQTLPEIERKIGYEFLRKDLLMTAMLHRSYLNEHKELVVSHNERLEFLGDTVLGLIVSEYLFKRFPDYKEGDLSFLRSRLVEAASCVGYLKVLDLEKNVVLGKGERMNDGRGRESILADLFEAIIGAIFLDGGFEVAKSFFLDHYQQEVESIIRTPVSNWKALLQDYAQKNFQKQPDYQVLIESGPDHSKVFEIAVLVNDQTLGIGKGSSKKEAQQDAARAAIQKLKDDENEDPV